MKKILLSLLISIPFFVWGQTNIDPSTTYSEDFNGLILSGTGSTWTDNGSIPNWYAASVSTNPKTSYSASTGSANTGDLYSLGSSATTERALGSLVSGSTGSIYYGQRLKNATGAQINSLSVSYTGEQWRQVDGSTAQTLSFSYQVSSSPITNLITGTWINVSSLNFTSPKFGVLTTGAIDGNLAANKTAITAIFNVAIPAGSEIMLRFSDVDDAGNDAALGIDNFSFTSYTTLPIQLTSFTGKTINQSILLNWNTASETNNDFYDVLRSADGKSFTSIGTIKGAGTSTSSKDYSFSDENPYAGTNYYQLVQHDYDGKTASSAIIPVDSKIDAATLSVYANVTSVKISLSSPNKTKGLLQVFDIAGRKLSESSVEVNKGFNSFELPLSLSNGVHFARFTSEAETINQKFIK
ncbi:hypothetical protein A5893_01720 [Pedobacter psychrophilus]|uniref:Secretion system C-terminal sorting domain-containing protein n=1 Tax=Pedobacter psychrophilus TaxID=1826909 RepID=A0A179DLF2_9SPHI|nr:T9SS type A sorting domain-containing protein [Pedobacter psychrophilus]OAQ41861.1 hypothetical protein A5893_01720 [Pedobacter psychrophilus]